MSHGCHYYASNAETLSFKMKFTDSKYFAKNSSFYSERFLTAKAGPWCLKVVFPSPDRVSCVLQGNGNCVSAAVASISDCKYSIKSVDGKLLYTQRMDICYAGLETEYCMSSRWMSSNGIYTNSPLLPKDVIIEGICTLHYAPTKFVYSPAALPGAVSEMHDSLAMSMKKLLDDGVKCDAIFKIGDSAVVVGAHKLILCNRSPVFAAMFGSDMSETSTGAISINDCSEAAFRAFLHYLYTDELPADVMATECMTGLFRLAHKYQVSSLLSVCEKHFVATLAVPTVVDYLMLADTYALSELRALALSFFAQYYKSVYATLDRPLEEALTGTLVSALLVELGK